MRLSGGQRYRAFLLRCWQEEDNAWRFSVDEIGRRAPRRGYTDLEAIVTFLEEELRKSSGDLADFVGGDESSE